MDFAAAGFWHLGSPALDDRIFMKFDIRLCLFFRFITKVMICMDSAVFCLHNNRNIFLDTNI
jgi:hypothetical protein